MTASKIQKQKQKKRSEAVIFWCLDKPVLRELNDAILTKEFSFIGVKKQNKTKDIAADHDKPTLRALNDAIHTKEFSFVGVQKKKTLQLIMWENQEYEQWQCLKLISYPTTYVIHIEHILGHWNAIIFIWIGLMNRWVDWKFSFMNWNLP